MAYQSAIKEALASFEEKLSREAEKLDEERLEQAELAALGLQVKCGAYVETARVEALEAERNALKAQVQELSAQLKDAIDEIAMLSTVRADVNAAQATLANIFPNSKQPQNPNQG